MDDSPEYKKNKMKQSTDTPQKVVFVSLKHFWLKVLRFFFFNNLYFEAPSFWELCLFFIV